MQQGLISIIIPTFNRANLLPETLVSVLAQTYKHWECIIVDDGSNDDTQKVISTYLLKDSRFKFFNRPIEKPKGANACRNYGFKRSKGEFINFLDSDDLLNEDFLRLKIEALINKKSLDFCACINSTFKDDPTNIISIDRPATLQSKNYIEDYLLNGLYFFTSSPLWRRDFLKDKELFDETLHRSQERDFHFRMLTLNAKYTYLDKVLVYKR
ncbi:MAG: glycosyltransferase, partial [Olleya sp.]